MLGFPSTAEAAQNPFVNASSQVGETNLVSGVGGRSLEQMVGSFIKGALSIAGVFFFGYMVWAGYLWMTAHGEKDKIEEAKKMISNAVIGLAITLSAYAITAFVVSRLVGTGALQQ
ncbi:hypothetical protein HY632_01580 [Candidatus Uhrbacteria bacterium]|nr:hypothetical protein [Candidatus Uhrbacteria bacterium]